MSDLFVEVVVAPSFHDEAMAVFAAKKALRVVELPVSRGFGVARLQAGPRRLPGAGPAPVRSVRPRLDRRDRPPARPSGEWNDLRFAWAAVASVKSNAILLARDEAAIGIGAGQMSRVDSVFLAVHKARQAGHDPAGSVARVRRLLSLRRQHRARRRRGHHGHHPARRLGARRGGRRGGQPPRPRHGDDRPPPVQTLAPSL